MKTSPRESRIARIRRLLPEAMAVERAVKAGYRMGKSFTKSTGGRKVITPGVLTTQYDARLRYSKKSMGKYKRRKWVSTVKRHLYLTQKQQPLRTWTYDFATTLGFSANAQRTFGWSLFSNQMGGEDNDLERIFVSNYGGTIADSIARTLFIKSACMDAQLRNVGENGMIVDVYKFKTSSLPWPVLGNTLEAIWNSTFNSQENIGGRNSANPANTPFQNPEFCRYFKILSKREILLGPGQVTTMQLRLPGNRQVFGRIVNTEASYPKYQMGFLFQIRGLPEFVAPDTQLAAGTLSIGIQKTYNYAEPPTRKVTEGIQNE